MTVEVWALIDHVLPITVIKPVSSGDDLTTAPAQSSVCSFLLASLEACRDRGAAMTVVAKIAALRMDVNLIF